MTDFAAFWQAYPRKCAKVAAQRAWTKLAPSPDLVLTILADVERRKQGEAWRKQGGAFIPHPSTYLNGRRWEDEDCTTASCNLSGLHAFLIDGEL